MTSIDTNISNYTLSELMAIIEVQDLVPDIIISKTNILINKFKTSNPKLSDFFKEIQDQLLHYTQGLNDNSPDETDEPDDDILTNTNEAIYPAGEQQITNWYQNEVLTQDNTIQNDKLTDRKQKIQIFGNQKAIMNREQIANTDTYQLPVKQDTLNPNLKNTLTRFINLDSQFRQYTNNAESLSTNYTLDLSDTLKDALSLRVYSYQIPFSWYCIDVNYNNTHLWIVDGSNNVLITIPSGNYNQISFLTQINKSFDAAGFTFPATSPINTPVSYNLNNGIITMNLHGGIYVDPTNISNTFTISVSTIVMFFDFTGTLQNNTTCKSANYFNNTLGWLMGYRLPYIQVEVNGNSAVSILDLNGPKYLILVIDDYNQNHVNNSLVSISQFSNTLKIPSYYSTDLPYTCIQEGNNIEELVSDVVNQSLFDGQTAQNGLLIAEKYKENIKQTTVVLPSAPRTLTQSQIYTINEINKNRNNLTNYLSKAPTSSDILAIIPVKTSAGVPTGSLLVEFSGSLQDNIRTYFGPVNIERMCVKLLDDKGNVLNLNGNDWCVTLVCECLYQY